MGKKRAENHTNTFMSQKNRSLAALWLVSPSFTSSSKSSGSGSVCRLAEAERLNNPDEEGVGVELSGDSGKTVVGVQVELESPRSELQIKLNNPERRTRKRTRNPRTIEYGLPADPNGRHYSLHVRRGGRGVRCKMTRPTLNRT